MDARKEYISTIGLHSLYLPLIFFSLLSPSSCLQKENKVGVILDMESWNGMMVNSCITMAISDFYDLNDHYKTRIVLQTSDSKGDPLQTLEAALILMVKDVEAMIVGAQMSIDAKLLALMGGKAEVPIFSLGGSALSSDKYPYFIQVSQSEAMQFEAIATLVKFFQWKSVVFVCEDTEHKPEVISNLFESFQEKSIQIDYISALPSTVIDDEILEELQKLMKMQTTIFVLHMTSSLAFRLVSSVKSLGMLNKGYAWILTDATRNLLYSTNSEELTQSLQGALAVKPYVPPSVKLQNFTRRWRKKFNSEDPFMNVKELSAYGLWAYDAIWALARAVEGVDTRINPKVQKEDISESNSANYGVSQIGKILLNELLKTRVIGLSGEFQIVNMKVPILKAFEIVNVIREGERRVGFWAKGVGIIREITHPDLYHNNTEVIIWPGGSITTPRGAKKLKVGLAINPEFYQLTGLEHDPQTNTTRPTGFCVEVFEAALKALPYDVPFEYTQFEGYMSDLVNQIYLENYDAGVGDITIMAARSVYVDFTIPYTDIGVGTIAKMKNDKDMWIFARPVGVDLCVLTAVIFVVTGIVIWVIEKPTNREFQGSPSEQIGTIFLSALFFSNREKLSSNLSRFVMLIWAFLVVILSASYTATLTSMLTVQQIKFASKGANVGYQVGPIVESNIRYNLSSMDYKLMPYSSLAEYAKALSKGSKNGGSDGIIDEIPYVKAFLSQYSSDYAMVDSAPITNGFGYPFRKGSPLVPDISREIARLREDGTLEMLEKKWYNRKPFSVEQEKQPQPQVLKVDSFGGLFLINGVSLGLAISVIMYYIVRQKYNSSRYIFEYLANGNLALMMMYFSGAEPEEMSV